MFFDEKFNFTLEEVEKIQKLRNRIEDCPDLEIGTEDILLTKYLYPRNWDVDKAFELLQSHYDFKNRYPEYVAQKPLEYYKELFFHTKSKYLLAKPDRDGRPVLVFETRDMATDRFPNYVMDHLQLDDYIFESLWTLPYVQKHGITIIQDLSQAGASVLKYMSPKIAKVMGIKNGVLPFAKAPCHCIRKGIFLNIAISTVLSFCSKEFKKTWFAHDINDLKKFHEMIGYENAPAHLGGPAENIRDYNLLYNLMEAKSDYVEKLITYKKATK